jgi:hypothetical protein
MGCGGEKKNRQEKRRAWAAEKMAQEAWREKKVLFYFKPFYKL